MSEIKYHTSLNDLPLNKFIDCIVDNNLSALIISHGEELPSSEELSAAWDNILAEYAELTGTSEYRMFCELYKEVEILKITLTQISVLAARGNAETGEMQGILRMTYDEYFADELNKLLKTKCRFNWNDQKSYHAELDKCVNRGKAFKIKYDLKKMQFEAIEKKNLGKKGERPTRQYFTSILVTLSDHAKYRIEETIKMPEYCERIRRFAEYCEVQKKT